MKKLFSVLLALCLLCTAAAALAEAKAPTMDDMPQAVTLEEDLELKDADFEGEWVVDKVFYGDTYLTPEQVIENGLTIAPMRIADGKLYIIYTNEEGEREESKPYTLENNQINVTDESGIDATFDKLEDGNLLMSLFLPGEGDAKICVSCFLVHPAK